MKVMGISAIHGTAAAAVVVDGVAIASATEERFTRQQGDPNLPRFSMQFCLDEAGLAPRDLDAVVFHEEPHTRFGRVFATTMGGPFPRSLSSFVGSMKGWMESHIWIRNEISSHLDVHPDLVSFIPHHSGHMANAFLTSPFDEAAVLIVDGAGEWSCTTLGRGTRRPEMTIEPICHLSYPHSLGLVQRGFAAFLGMGDNEADVADLALYGRPDRVEEVQRILVTTGDGGYRVEPGWFRFERMESPDQQKAWTLQFEAVFGEPRDVREPWSWPGDTGRFGSELDQHYADLAASVQAVIGARVIDLCRKLGEETDCTSICLGGDVATDPAIVRLVRQEGGFDEVFVPPDPGDGGNALGAALYFHALEGVDEDPPLAPSPMLGRAYDPARAKAIVPFLRVGAWRRFKRPEAKEATGTLALRSTSYEQEKDLVAACVERLDGGCAIGWHQGRFGCAQRTLGERAILADPRNAGILPWISQAVTGRPSFCRPSLAVTPDEAAHLISSPPVAAPWNQCRATVLSKYREELAPCLAPDGTCLPLICSKEEHPRLHALLLAWQKQHGVAALMLLAFQEHGYPLTASPADALLVFARSELSVLVLENVLIEKVTT